MSQPRLSQALAGGDALPGAGRILVLGATAETDLSALPKDRTLIVQGLRPEHDALAARGFDVVPDLPEGATAAAAVVILPRARDAGRARVAAAVAALAEGAPVWIDGQKTDGVETMLRDLRARVPVGEALSKAHGKCFPFTAPGPAGFADWRAAPRAVAEGFVTLPGVFSADGPDAGSRALASALPDRLPRRIADLGAGWGWLAAQILARPGVEEVHLVEADHTALACAKVNVTDPRARFHWADATRFRPPAPLDGVVMNPPFHAGRAADPALGVAFIRAAAGMLTTSGRLWMVANRHLPYEAALAQAFREVAEIGGDGGFKVFLAARPVPAGGKPAPAAARSRPRG